jgi:putative sterol carrier protein
MSDYLFLSEEWVQQIPQAINTNASYQKSAKGISDRMAFLVKGDHPAANGGETHFYLEIKNGQCVDAVREKRTKADFFLTGSYENWKAVLDGDMDVIKAITKGKIKMKGSMIRMLKNAIPTVKLVGCFQSVPTRYA